MGVAPDTLASYRGKYASLSPLLTLDWHFEVDDPITIETFMSGEQLHNTLFYREFLSLANWIDQLMVILDKSATQVSMIALPKTESAAAATTEDKALVRMLVPHTRRAAAFQGTIARNATRVADLIARLDLVRPPLLLFDSSGSCIETNQAARQFLDINDVPRLKEVRVQTRQTFLDERIATVMADLAIRPEEIGPRPVPFAFARRDGQRVVAHVMPIAKGPHNRIGGGGRAAFAVFIQAAGDMQPLPGDMLVKLYRLTPAETRLLGLLGQDFSLRDAAAALGITMPTARSHLQRIFEKTHTNRQSQLMKLILSALPRPPD